MPLPIRTYADYLVLETEVFAHLLYKELCLPVGIGARADRMVLVHGEVVGGPVHGGGG